MKINKDPNLNYDWENFILNPYYKEDMRPATSPNDAFKHGRESRARAFTRLLEKTLSSGVHIPRDAIKRLTKGTTGTIEPARMFLDASLASNWVSWGIDGLWKSHVADAEFTGRIPDLLRHDEWYLKTSASAKPSMLTGTMPDFFISEFLRIFPRFYQIYVTIAQPEGYEGEYNVTRRVDMYDIVTRLIPMFTHTVSALARAAESFRDIGATLRDAEEWLQCAYCVTDSLSDMVSAMLIPLTGTEKELNSLGFKRFIRRKRPVMRTRLLEDDGESLAQDTLLFKMYTLNTRHFLGLMVLFVEAYETFKVRRLLDTGKYQDIFQTMCMFMEATLATLQMHFMLLFWGTHVYGGLRGILAGIASRRERGFTFEPWGDMYTSDVARFIQHVVLHDADLQYEEAAMKERRVRCPFVGMERLKRMEPGFWDTVFRFYRRFFEIRESGDYTMFFKVHRDAVLYALCFMCAISGTGALRWLRSGVPEGMKGIRFRSVPHIRVFQMGFHNNIAAVRSRFPYNPRN